MRLERDGELFLAYDVLRQGLEKFPQDLALRHRAVLCLASTGATQKAAEELVRLGLDPVPDISLATRLGLDIGTLKPRLLKDLALASDAGNRTDALAAAAAAYEAVYVGAKQAGNAEAYYPCVNAATLYLLAGDVPAAVALARDVLRELETRPSGDGGFYEIASELEAHLVLGNIEQARERIEIVRERVRSSAKTDYRGLASMVRQLRLVIEAKRFGRDLAAALTPPTVIHYTGHIISPPGAAGRFPAAQEDQVRAAIDNALTEEDVAFGYGSLAAGADILFAEALLERGASLHVVLPFDREEFVNISVRPSGAQWVKRFARCYRAAERSGTIRYATDDRHLGDDHLFGYCSQLAMGLALLRAQHLAAPAKQIVVWDGKPPSGPVGTAADRALWRHAGFPQRTISVDGAADPLAEADGAGSERQIKRHTRAMLFSDVHGFSRLSDAQLPAFIEAILGASALAIERNQEGIVFANTWGDGLFLVFDDAGRAANCALELQDAISGIDLESNGLPHHLGLRVGLHFGPVFAAKDPILRRENFFGAQVSRTARVEPVTPEGCVYVTETMAAVLALQNADQFTCQYVGMTEAAKHYGQMRMFLLKRRASRQPGA